MMHIRVSTKQFFIFTFILVVIAHISFMAVKFKGPRPVAAAPKTKVIKFRLEPGTLTKFRQSRKQIVASDESANKKAPENAKYLSDKNRSFEKQTRARKIDRFNRAGRGGAKQTASTQGGAKSSPSRPGKRPSPNGLSLSDIGAFDRDFNPYARSAREYAQTSQGIRNGDPNSKGVGATNDYLEEVPLGDLTQLNSQEFKYYGFYHRIRQKLEQFWDRSIQEKAAQLARGGRSLANSDHVTALEITLDPMGEITAIRVMSASGVRELDEAAIESFNEAGPFENPPKDLVVDGKVVLEWGFIVKT
jgi:TonB family protein